MPVMTQGIKQALTHALQHVLSRMRKLQQSWLLLALLLAPAAHAHLVPAGQGMLRLVGDSAYATISIPAQALAGYDDNGDGLISAAEINAHRDMLSMQLSTMLRHAGAVRAGLCHGAACRGGTVDRCQHRVAGAR